MSQAAWNLNEYDYKEVFAIDKTWNSEFDAIYFKGILKQMQDSDNLVIVLCAKEFDKENKDTSAMKDINEENEEKSTK